MFTLRTENKAIVTVTYTLVGAFSFSILIVGYAYCSEITFPINEATAGGLFQFPLQVFGFVMTIVCPAIINKWEDSNQGVFWSFILLIICTALGTFSAAIMKPIPKHRNQSIKDEATKSFEASFKEKEDQYIEKDTND